MRNLEEPWGTLRNFVKPWGTLRNIRVLWGTFDLRNLWEPCGRLGGALGETFESREVKTLGEPWGAWFSTFQQTDKKTCWAVLCSQKMELQWSYSKVFFNKIVVPFSMLCLWCPTLAREYYYDIPELPGKKWSIGEFSGVEELDDECKHVFGKDWRVSLKYLLGVNPSYTYREQDLEPPSGCSSLL